MTTRWKQRLRLPVQGVTRAMARIVRSGPRLRRTRHVFSLLVCLVLSATPAVCLDGDYGKPPVTGDYGVQLTPPSTPPVNNTPPPPRGSPQDVINKTDTGKKIMQGLGDGLKGVETSLGGKLLGGDLPAFCSAVGNSVKILNVGTKVVDAYDKNGVSGAIQVVAVDGSKHVIGGMLTPIATTAATGALIAAGAGPVAVGIGVAIVGLGARWVVGLAVDGVVYVAQGVGNAIGNKIIDAQQAQEDADAAAQTAATFNNLNQINQTINSLNNVSPRPISCTCGTVPARPPPPSGCRPGCH